MTALRTAAQRALEAMEDLGQRYYENTGEVLHRDVYRALRAALAQQAERVERVAHSVVSGALFDFMGWLTSRRERLVLSGVDNAAPAADAIKDFAEMRGLNIDDALVKEWQDNITAPPQRKPLTEEEAAKACGASGNLGPLMQIVRAVERAHKIGEEK